MAARKPKIEYYWTQQVVAAIMFKGEATPTKHGEPVVNWRMVGANGEVMCQSTQGFRDKTDAVRAVTTVAGMFNGDVDAIRHVGPGPKPGTTIGKRPVRA